MKTFDVQWICPNCGQRHCEIIKTNHPLKVKCSKCFLKSFLFQTINPKWTNVNNIKKKVIDQYKSYQLELNKYKEANDEDMIAYYENKMSVIEQAHPDWI